jgi:hypothetical protein
MERILDAVQQASRAAEKVLHFVILSEVKNLSVV